MLECDFLQNPFTIFIMLKTKISRQAYTFREYILVYYDRYQYFFKKILSKTINSKLRNLKNIFVNHLLRNVWRHYIIYGIIYFFIIEFKLFYK